MSTAFSMALVVFDVSHSKIRKCRDMVLCTILLFKRSMVCLEFLYARSKTSDVLWYGVRLSVCLSVR